MVAPNKVVNARVDLTDATVTTVVPARPGSTFYITRLTVQNKHATNAAVLTIQEDSIVDFKINLKPAGDPIPIPGLDVTPIPITAGRNLRVASSNATSDILVNIGGFWGVA